MVLQYLQVFSYIIFLINFTYKQNRVWLGVVSATIVFVLLWLIIYLVRNFMYNPKECRILWYIGKNVYMKSVHVNDNIKNNFFSDLELIVSDAKRKNKDYLYMRTHFLCVAELLGHYKGFKRKECQHICENLMIGEEKEFNSDIGRIKLVRIPDGINLCAKYEHPIIMTFHEFKKTLKETLLFDIYIYL